MEILLLYKITEEAQADFFCQTYQEAIEEQRKRSGARVCDALTGEALESGQRALVVEMIAERLKKTPNADRIHILEKAEEIVRELVAHGWLPHFFEGAIYSEIVIGA